MNTDANGVAPIALDYAEPPAPVGPQTSKTASRLEINLGTSTQRTFTTRVVLIAMAVSLWAFLMLKANDWWWRSTDAFNMVLFIVVIVRVVRTRLEPDVIVADAEGITARGPTTGMAQVRRADIARFTFRRDGVFWLTQLRVRLTADGISTGDEHVIAVADRAAVIQASADLNRWLESVPVIARPGISSRARWFNRAVLAVAMLLSLAVAAWPLKAGIQLPIEQKLRANGLFVAAIVVVIVPSSVVFGFLSRRG